MPLADPGLVDLQNVETRLHRLEAIDGIWHLFMAYRRSVDERDFDGFARLFVDDGVWSGDIGSATGPVEIRALLDRFLEIYPDDSTRTYHLIANLEVLELDGDRAKTRSTFCYITRDPSDAPCVMQVGHYIDTVVRSGAVWRFAHRQAYVDIPYTAAA